MKRLFFLLFILLQIQISIPAVVSAFLKSEEPLHLNTITHDLKVMIYPQEHSFVAEDTVIIPKNLLPEIRFFLHKGLNASVQTKDVQITKEPGDSGIYESFKVRLPPGANTFLLKYGGIINHPIEQYGREQARGYSQTKGMISGEGVYLAGSSLWYPMFEDKLLTFKLRLELPPEWDAVSQGERTYHAKDISSTIVQWESPEPQEEIFIAAARFHEYIRSAGKTRAMVFLRTPDQGLAGRYLNATIRYISMYETLIGPYPYEKFALVENFWETGFGMPSFTLLGPKVIRFPFIIDSSYPHEILHNWWGNSVFPDYENGNWSEGLTAYLSDHLLKEQRGEGAEYRQTTLQKYADYVISGRDFPLTDFRSRHSSSSEAIGYGKSLMFFHMLRLYLGDKAFIDGLQDFYRRNEFKFASFTDIGKSFELVSGRDLKAEFDQWITKTGAPKLRVLSVKGEIEGGKHILTAIIEQIQKGLKYHLLVPIAVTMEGKKQAYQTTVTMDKERVEVKLALPARPLRIDIDPEFDIFRRLDRDETPPAISQALGSGKVLAILPSSASKPLLQAYREFANSLSNAGPDEVETRLDAEISRLPSDKAVVIVGWENRFFDKMVAALSPYGTTVDRKSIRIGKTEVPFDNHSLVLTARNPANKETAMMFIAADLPDALSGLSRKLPHYHKYSYLVFEGAEPANVAKGRWPVHDSPMTVHVPLEDDTVTRVEMGKLEGRKPLIAQQPEFSSERMMETIRFLSDDELKGRALGTEGLHEAAEYIAKEFREAGLEPAGDEDGSYFQTWEEEDTNTGGHNKVKMENVMGIIPGKKSEWSNQSVIVGAHYDHLGVVKGQIFHGAGDNASGISVLVELARVLGKNFSPDRNLVFVAFTGEEEGKKGSEHYANNQKRYPVKHSFGMLNLDTVGRLGKNNLLVLGAGSAKEWVHIFKGAAHVTGVEIETVSEELDSSDQKSFQKAGVPAVQLFTGPHPDYHRPTDTFDKIDPEGLVKVASVTKEVIEYLSSIAEPLKATISAEGKAGSRPERERKVSLGIIPDFVFNGTGCRLAGVIADSPAEQAGLREGDIVIRINSADINKLKDLSDILKSLSPGDRVSIIFMRGKKEMTAEVNLTAR